MGNLLSRVKYLQGRVDERQNEAVIAEASSLSRPSFLSWGGHPVDVARMKARLYFI